MIKLQAGWLLLESALKASLLALTSLLAAAHSWATLMQQVRGGQIRKPWQVSSGNSREWAGLPTINLQPPPPPIPETTAGDA